MREAGAACRLGRVSVALAAGPAREQQRTGYAHGSQATSSVSLLETGLTCFRCLMRPLHNSAVHA
eukprot:4846978-Pleurochrysis_carterae.AAC.7